MNNRAKPGDSARPRWEVERDRFGLMFSGPLEVGECIEVVPAAEHERLRGYVEWVASHRLDLGIYADEDHSYDEWFAPDGAEADFSDVVERAREALGVSHHPPGSAGSS